MMDEMEQEQVGGWGEEDSAVYRALAQIAVPGRVEQLAALLCLLPFGRDDEFRAVDLGCGEGVLSYAVLAAFPRASVLSLDGSVSMREHAAALLEGYGERAVVHDFNLQSWDWLNRLDGAGCVMSSLVVHHLTAEGKQRLFREAYGRMAERGALLTADLVLPQRAEGWRLYANQYDSIARAQSVDLTGDDALFDRLEEEKWNYYRHPEESEMPSPLQHQLGWLADVGFRDVDCFWMRAGHAVYGGYKGGGASVAAEDALSLDEAMVAVESAMAVNG